MFLSLLLPIVFAMSSDRFTSRFRRQIVSHTNPHPVTLRDLNGGRLPVKGYIEEKNEKEKNVVGKQKENTNEDQTRNFKQENVVA